MNELMYWLLQRYRISFWSQFTGDFVNVYIWMPHAGSTQYYKIVRF